MPDGTVIEAYLAGELSSIAAKGELSAQEAALLTLLKRRR
jgi:hypothetical protein